MQGINWLGFVLSAVQSIPALVAQVQQHHPDTPGAGKKLLVLDRINAALVAAEPIYGPMLAGHPTVQAGISTAIDAAVDVFNHSAAIVAAHQQQTQAAAAAVVVPAVPASIPAAPPVEGFIAPAGGVGVHMDPPPPAEAPQPDDEFDAVGDEA